MKKAVFLLLLIFSFSSTISFAGCLANHFKGAIKTNKKRLPLYSKLTNGASEKISKKLIWAERMGLMISIVEDKKSEIFKMSGLSLYCDFLVKMDTIQAFGAPTNYERPKIENYSPVPALFEKRFLKLFRDGKLKELEHLAYKLYIEREENKGFNCMYKHTIESLVKILRLRQAYINKAKVLGLKSPRKLIDSFLRDHLRALKLAREVDQLAAPIQANGVPIICSDVPAIKI